VIEDTKLSKHDQYVLELYEEIKHRYDEIKMHFLIRGKKRSLGEIDIYARKGDVVDLYEVKCSHRIVKARQQMKKIRKHIKAEKCNAFFYCGSSGLLVML